MSDDTFIREVNEEMRHDRAHAIWRRFGKLIIGLVVLTILGTIAFVAWERYRAAEAAADGDRYFAAVDLAETGDSAGAVAAFEALAEDGVGAYPHLAQLRIASTLAASDDRTGALAALDELAASSAPQALRDVASVRAGYILVDHGTTDDVRQRVERLTNEAEALRHPAREALGLSLWKAGDGEAARAFFQQITEDLSAPAGISQRARLMLEIIDTGSALPPPAAPGEAPAPAPAPAAQPTPASEAGPAEAPAAGSADAPPTETGDATLTTPLAEQIDLPPAAEPAAPTVQPAEPSIPTSEPVPGTPPPS